MNYCLASFCSAMDGLLGLGQKHWKTYSIADSEQLLCKHTRDLGDLALGLETRGFAEGTNPKIEMLESTRYKCLLTYATGASWAVWDSAMHHSRSYLLSLLWKYLTPKPQYTRHLIFTTAFWRGRRDLSETYLKESPNFSNFTIFFKHKNKPMFQSIQHIIK